MNFTDWGALAAAVVISTAHLMAHRVQRLDPARLRFVEAFSAGMIAAYVFMFMLPQLGSTEEALGADAGLVLLGGFVVFYGVEQYLISRPELADRIFRQRVVVSWLYSFLVVYTLPTIVQQNDIRAAMVVIALGLHVLQYDSYLACNYAEFSTWGRWVLASAPMVALLVISATEKPSSEVSNYLTAFIAGAILINIFRDQISSKKQRAFVGFVLGVGIFAVVFGIQSFVEQS